MSGYSTGLGEEIKKLRKKMCSVRMLIWSAERGFCHQTCYLVKLSSLKFTHKPVFFMRIKVLPEKSTLR